MILPLGLGALVGLVLGLLGGGGSVLAIPALTYALKLEPKAAVAASLWVVGSAAAVAAVAHHLSGHVRWKVAAGFGVLGAAGALLSARLAQHLPGLLQLALFAVVMLLAGRRMLRRARAASTPEDPTSEPPSTDAPAPAAPPASGGRVVAAALGTGVLTGLVGVGGGFLIVPALVMWVGLPMREAIGTSLVVIVFNAVGGSAGYGSYLSPELGVTLPFVGGAVVASLGGSLLGRRISPRRLEAAFGVGVMVVAVAMRLQASWAWLAP